MDNAYSIDVATYMYVHVDIRDNAYSIHVATYMYVHVDMMLSASTFW